MGKLEEPPPVSVRPGTNLPPAIGYPIPVRKDGTLSLPYVSPALKVKGRTITQIENLIRRAYTVDRQILKPGKDRIIVTIIKERTHRVTVMRQDRGRRNVEPQVGEAATRGYTLDLPAYKNDVLNALAETGGLPGQDAKNEILILRSSLIPPDQRDEIIRDWFSGEAPCRKPKAQADPALQRIPLQLPAGEMPQFNAADITLDDGDVVFIPKRPPERFSTGGLLEPGAYALPRDYDVDVMQALVIAGHKISTTKQIDGAVTGVAEPSQLYILRQTPCDGSIIIAIDLSRAARDPKFRPLVVAGDVLVLQTRQQPTDEPSSLLNSKLRDVGIVVVRFANQCVLSVQGSQKEIN